jgi:hypothetical protein
MTIVCKQKPRLDVYWGGVFVWNILDKEIGQEEETDGDDYA